MTAIFKHVITEAQTTKTRREPKESTSTVPAGLQTRADLRRQLRKRPAPAFQTDPTYTQLLQHFQNAEWAACLESIDRLLQAYPGDKSLLSFKQEIRTRSEQQEHSEWQRLQVEGKRRRVTRRRVVLGAIVGIGVMGMVAWFANAYRAEDHRQRLAAAATQTSEALAGKIEAANSFMSAGKPYQALVLYYEIQRTDPGYPNIDGAIQAAQLSMTVETLYQQGIQASENSDVDGALKLLEQVQQLQPGYKDVTQLVAKLQQDQKEASLLKTLNDAYSRGDSLQVVQSFEAIQALDPFFDYSNLRDQLFSSYSNLVFDIAARPDPKLEDIQAAVRYYRAAMALFPQSVGYARQRAELQDVAIGLLATQYSLQGISTLESSDYSIQGLEESLRVLQRARQSAPGSRAVAATLDKAQIFITSYDRLVHGDWDEAISGFEDLYHQEADFAGGRVRYFLYEAYTARGDLLLLNGDLGGAFEDYQAAEKYAWEDQQNALRIFQIEVRLGGVVHKMGKYDQAASFYHSAFAQAAYQDRLAQPAQRDLLGTVLNADSDYAQGSWLSAVNLYEQAAKQADHIYELTSFSALPGDTLPSIAFDSGSTLWSLRSANAVGDSLILARSRQLSVPILPPVHP